MPLNTRGNSRRCIGHSRRSRAGNRGRCWLGSRPLVAAFVIGDALVIGDASDGAAGVSPTMPMKASGPLALPRASAPKALKARAPAMRSPVRDRLTDGRMIKLPFSALQQLLRR